MKRGRADQSGIMKLFLRIVIIMMSMWTLILGITLSITMNYSVKHLEEKIENFLMGTATSLAGSEMVKEALNSGCCSAGLIQYLDDMVSNTKDLDVITIADTDSIRLYHVVHERIGEEFVGGDQDPVLLGKSYFNDAVGTLGMQRRAFCPVYGSDGKTVTGFVVCAATMESLDIVYNEITDRYWNIAVLVLVITLVAASMFTLMFNYSLKGFSPEWLVQNYLMQNDLINSLDEGIVITDEKGSIQLANKAAEAALGQKEDILFGRPLDELILAENGSSLLGSNLSNAATTRPNVLCSSVVMQNSSGYMLLLKDRTEAVRRAQQLAGTRHIISALRANTHDFMNRLQVIAGLLQMGRYEQVNSYIGKIAAVQTQAMGPVLQHICNPNVAALLLGKLGNMRELEISMTLLANSSLPEHSAFLSTTDLVTLIGNLVENAIEAINARQSGDPREIVVQITEGESDLLIMVSDTGTGIDPGDMPHIYDFGFSTKAPSGRGIGMGLVREIVERRNGSIELDSEPEVGTTVTVIFNDPR